MTSKKPKGALCGDGLDDYLGPPPYQAPSKRQLEAMQLLRDVIKENDGEMSIPESGLSGSLKQALLDLKWIDIVDLGNEKPEIWLTARGYEILQMEEENSAVWSEPRRQWVPSLGQEDTEGGI